jgi:hypothetical protein
MWPSLLCLSGVSSPSLSSVVAVVVRKLVVGELEVAFDLVIRKFLVGELEAEIERRLLAVIILLVFVLLARIAQNDCRISSNRSWSKRKVPPIHGTLAIV